MEPDWWAVFLQAMMWEPSLPLVILHLQHVTSKVIACLFQAVKFDGVERA